MHNHQPGKVRESGGVQPRRRSFRNRAVCMLRVLLLPATTKPKGDVGGARRWRRGWCGCRGGGHEYESNAARDRRTVWEEVNADL